MTPTHRAIALLNTVIISLVARPARPDEDRDPTRTATAATFLAG